MASLTDQCPMPLGKHKGKSMDSVPDDYLMWLWDKNELKYRQGNLTHVPTQLVMDYIKDNLDAIEANKHYKELIIKLE